MLQLLLSTPEVIPGLSLKTRVTWGPVTQASMLNQTWKERPEEVLGTPIVSEPCPEEAQVCCI